MTEIRKAVVIVLDGVGIGELPDADSFGDSGSHTLGNIAKKVGGLKLPNLEKLGLGNIAPIEGVKPLDNPEGNFGKMAEVSPGKDSTTGHWELGGVHLDQPFPTYPNGFPEKILSEFSRRTGRGILGNKPASGTEIIKELGEEHVRTGDLIVYTSADSVFQIAAHEKVIPVETLYEYCRIAREILTGEHAVARVIARPFVGDSADTFTRTRGRRDYSLKPPKPTMLDRLMEAGIPTIGIGKIDDLYAGKGLSEKIHTKSNAAGIEETINQLAKMEYGLLMTNLVDFDMLYGHRNNVEGFYKELQYFDEKLPEILREVREDTVLFITADHGNDPTTPSTDHAREYVPLLVYGPGIKRGVNLGIRKSFADLGQTVAEIFGVERTPAGKSFWSNLR
ncbi:MAG: phosphopentomutase [Calditrichia bacterium]